MHDVEHKSIYVQMNATSKAPRLQLLRGKPWCMIRYRSVEERNSLHCGCHLAMRSWPSVSWYLWALQLALMVQKCHLGTALQDICKKLKRTKHSHETRGNQSCFTPFRPLTTSGSVCFSNRAPLIWNFLPQSIRTCTPYTSFKSHFLDFILKSRSILALALYDTNI